jgi:ABC-type nitrate/sulfonate/bicarbonate transport system substrate-binding protein
MRNLTFGILFAFAATIAGFAAQRGEQVLTPIKVELITRAVSKTPVLIAYDRGIYKKYGLDVTLWLPKGEFPGAIETGARLQHPEFSVDGGVPMVSAILSNRGPKRLAIASNDCEVRFNIVGQKGMKSLDELKGKRLGISADGAMTGFIYRAMAKRMGWTPGKDFTVVEDAQKFDHLVAGKADAFVADDRYMALAKEAGYPILADTSSWKQPIAGNSVRVETNWINDPKNREIATRFLKATIEGMAIYMNNRDEAIRVLQKYHGIKDRQVALAIYQEGLKMSRKMEPCVQGFKDMFTLGYPAEINKYTPSDFYDESFINELDKSGFIATAYKTAK